MTPEEKLEHLRDYLFFRIEKFTYWNIKQIMNFYFETGILILGNPAPETFEEYLLTLK